MYFEKFHGTGNDFIIIENFNNEVTFEKANFAREVCDRHFGVGADGLMIVEPSIRADIKMIFYNQDGSIAPMCGNGIRCFAKYVFDKKIVEKETFTVETLAGIMNVHLINSCEHISNIKINLGCPDIYTKNFPINTEKETFIDEPINVCDQEVKVSTLNLGTLHTVLQSNHIDETDVEELGKHIEKHTLFPEKTNVNFYEINDKNNITLETYERGVGRTLACGTGCAATAVISNRLNQTSKVVNVHVQGGTLRIEITENGVFMTGPANRICKGEYIVNY